MFKAGQNKKYKIAREANTLGVAVAASQVKCSQKVVIR